MEDKHTPGPWKVGTALSGKPAIYRGQILGVYNYVCVVDNTEGRSKAAANAALIAAAPDLLAAARIAISSLLSRELGYEELRAAIEKATL